jgi:hypothetical protein
VEGEEGWGWSLEELDSMGRDRGSLRCRLVVGGERNVSCGYGGRLRVRGVLEEEEESRRLMVVS